MKRYTEIFMVTLSLGLLFLTTGCMKCIKIQDISATPSTLQIAKDNVVIKAAILPNGNPSPISVEDYCPPGGDGSNEVKIGWSQTNAGAAEYATINFPQASFGDGPSKVNVDAAHYNSCRLKAYDKSGNMVSTVDHTSGQRTLQTLTLTGGKISQIDVIGAEIGISEICYCEWPLCLW